MNIGIETESIEFKKSTSELKEGIISLSSMLNKNGYGTLYFGVKDNGDIVGQQIGDRTLREISQAIGNYIKPQIIPTSDIITKTKAPNQDLYFNQIKTLFLSKGLTINNNNFENNLGFLLENNQYNLMAWLLADKNDISIKIATFAGKDKSQLIKRNEYGFKCLLMAMEQVISYVESINETMVTIGNHQREELQLFDMSCFREAWINACLHTSWEKMNPPAVYVFCDRIEIISTGGLPQDLSKEEFFKGISRPVNLKLQKIFGQLGYVEQTGHGIPLIISNYGKQAFDIMDNYLNVVIPFARKQSTHIPQQVSNNLNEAQRNVCTILENHPEFTIQNIVEQTQYSDGYVRKILNSLKELGYLKRIGSNKNGYWQINR